MSITHQDVRHIARLARIDLSPAEEQKFEKDLSAIFGFIEKLKELDTEGVLPMAGGTLLETVMRTDEYDAKGKLEKKAAHLVDAAPEKKDAWIKVKQVFE